MATIGNTYISLVDVFKRTDPDGGIDSIIEMLREINPILEDAIAIECNNGSNHLSTVRTGLPSATWRMLYKGVNPGKSTTKQVTDATGWCEAWSEVDAKLVELNSDPRGLRESEAAAFLQGMSNDMATAMFYGNQATDPEQFTGLAPRFNALSTVETESGYQIIDAGGTGSDNTSVWFVTWSNETCKLLYPENSMGGLQRDDKGKTTKENSDGSLYDVYREKFSWDIGMGVGDWRYVSRVANIDVSDLAAGTVDIYKFLRQGYYKLRNRRVSNGRQAIYCNTDVMEALDAAATDHTNVRLRYTEVEGEEVLTYRKIPIREVDALLNDEARIT